MNMLGFKVVSYKYPDLYTRLVLIEWDEFENIVKFNFEDDDNSNSYKTLIDIFNNKIKHSITINVSGETDKLIRKYDLELLPNTFRPSKLHAELVPMSESYLLTSFRILKYELTFNE